MIKFYYHPSPNPAKVALFLEEVGLQYELVPVDTRKGDQHDPSYLLINPNGKTPALVDGDAVIFDSNAILLYLAERTGKFLPAKTPEARGQMYSWLMFVASGILWRKAPTHSDNFGNIRTVPTHFVLDKEHRELSHREGSFLPSDWDDLWSNLN